MIIAVDFDGTIVEHRYPKIGKEIPFAIQTLRTLIKEGHQLILWSVRGALLQEALDWCHERAWISMPPTWTNPSPTRRRETETTPAKSRPTSSSTTATSADSPDWGRIYDMIHNGKTWQDYISPAPSPWEEDEPQPKKRWWKL